MRLFYVIVLLLCGCLSFGQYSFSGYVSSIDNEPLVGANIQFGNQSVISDENGYFIFKSFEKGSYSLRVNFLGYNPLIDTILLNTNLKRNIVLIGDSKIIDSVFITENVNINSEVVSSNYIQQNYTGSLVHSLGEIVGVNVMSVGSGSAKPIVRGLGFNRMVVSNNGIKHEGQQWGADHGLEIDAFSVEKVELLKGIASIEYGSEAIGGVLQVKNNLIPDRYSFSGKATFFTRSVNESLGLSTQIKWREDEIFQKFNATYIDYADFKTTTDRIVYLNRNIPIHNKSLKNSAGNEMNFMYQFGYVLDDYNTMITIENNSTKSGFFPGSHGVPDLNRLQDDGDSRNIEFPYQKANHFTFQNEHNWSFKESELQLNFGFQNNIRQEYSEFHTHYSNQQVPSKDADLELDFKLNTFSFNTKYNFHLTDNSISHVGIQSQVQDNKIAGYSYLLPEYSRFSSGLFFTHKIIASDKLNYDFGLRYDYSEIKIDSFNDYILYEYLIGRGYSDLQAQQYSIRTPELSRSFNNFNAQFGLNYQLDSNWNFGYSLGTSFRNPNAIELGSNGIHHGSFRHEKGDVNIDSEKGVMTDFRVNYSNSKIKLSVSPYLYYFSNYIFLKPTGEFSILPHAGQIYKYNQSKAILTGVEFESQIILKNVKIDFNFEYIYNKQLGEDNNYPLPYTPPLNSFLQLNYSFENRESFLFDSEAFINSKIMASQTRIAQNENQTNSSIVIGLGYSTKIRFKKFNPKLTFTIQNLLNTKYYNHMSYYRALEIPEQARNVQLMLQIPF